MEYYLTPERLEALKEELNELKSKKRIEIAERLQRAKELGDLSENAEYAEAKDAQAQLEMRILELEEVVKNASIITKSGTKDRVELGSTIGVSKDEKKFVFTIVGSNEARPEAGLISNESPLGKAFFGKKVGDSVNAQTPSGEVTYRILKIE